MRKAGLVLLVLLAGCAMNQNSGVRPLRPLRPLQIPTGPFLDSTAEALQGTLMYEGGCLIFRDDVSRGHLLPVWPYGTVFNGTSIIVHLPGKAEQRLVLAQEFVMYGHRVPWANLPPADFAAFQRQCGSEPFAVRSVRPAN
jgi:hypothetical protein